MPTDNPNDRWTGDDRRTNAWGGCDEGVFYRQEGGTYTCRNRGGGSTDGSTDGGLRRWLPRRRAATQQLEKGQRRGGLRPDEPHNEKTLKYRSTDLKLVNPSGRTAAVSRTRGLFCWGRYFMVHAYSVHNKKKGDTSQSVR